ncbi:MAG TPA: efflux RND transporter periplasmic adaptor subunit [Planctomycetaceae bacterium]|nr:efflux RND transporter periplasmic adaptor subunit [Planctomycetaceae bacterium]
MPAPSAPSELPSAGLSSRALERGLDELAQRVRGDVEPFQFLTDVLRLLVHTARADRAAVWMRGGDQKWTRIGLSVLSADGAVESEPNVAGPDWLAGAWQQSGPEAARFTQDGSPCTRLAGPVRQGGQPTGVLEGVWDGSVPQATLLPFVGAVCELTGDFLVQHELRMLRRERLEWKQWEQFQTALSDADGIAKLAAVVTHDGRALTGSDRVTVLHMHGLRARGESVSGVDVLDPRSTTLQALERVAQAAAQMRQPVWHSVDAPHRGTARDACESLQQLADCMAMGALPLMSADGWVSGVIVCERMTATPDVAAWQKRCESLARFATPPWSALVERRLSWIGRWSRRRQRFATTFGKLGVAAAAIAVIAAALAVIPAEHVVTGEGQLMPDRRRDVFASTSGVVSDIRVRHGDEVAVGQTLVVLRDPQIELETARVVGELATVRTRLGVVQSARIAAVSSGVDAAIRAQQLTAEEEELKQRLESLARQQALLDEQRATWELKSPIAGQLLTWDLESRLTGRPVERGQVLLTVGDIAGDWVVEARIRERDIGPVWAAAKANTEPLAVEFVTTLDTRTVRRGQIRDIARTAEIDDRGDSTLRVTIAFDRSQPGPLRPGATVMPRIMCGKKSLGYVWLHPLLDAVRRQWWSL